MVNKEAGNTCIILHIHCPKPFNNTALTCSVCLTSTVINDFWISYSIFLLAVDGVQYWERVRNVDSDNRPVWDRWRRATASDIELNSYALLIYLQRGLIIESQRIAKWLMSQRNANGGFSSTQVGEVSFSEIYIKIYIFFSI